MEKGAAAIGGVEALVHLRRANRGGHGQEAAGQSFGQAHDVGHYRGAIAGKHGSAAAKASQDFVGDEQDIVFRAELPDALQELRGVHNHSARALEQRLNNQRRDFVVIGREQAFERFDAIDIAGGTDLSYGAAKTIRGRGAQHRESQLFKSRNEGRVCADGHGSGGVAVVGVLQRDELAICRVCR